MFLLLTKIMLLFYGYFDGGKVRLVERAYVHLVRLVEVGRDDGNI